MIRLFTLSCFALLAACSGAGEDAPEPATNDAEFTDTIVTIKADGTIEQSTHTVTAEARKAELAQLSKSNDVGPVAPSLDSAPTTRGPANQPLTLKVNTVCPGADLYVYDASKVKKICISGSHLSYNDIDQLDLRNVRYRCIGITITGACSQWDTWAGKAEYVWPGDKDGRLYDVQPGAGPSSVFSAGGPRQKVDPATSIIVVLTGPYLG